MANFSSRNRAVRIVVQSRLGSSRLPGKALLPVGPLPLVVLSAKRAANTGLDVVVAIPQDPEDDAIAEHLERHGLAYCRGSRDSVLERFLTATHDMDEDSLIVRLTADNVFPDGALIQEVLEVMVEQDIPYLATQMALAPLPYGLSVEAFGLSHLRQAHRETSAPFDLEHVTPYIRKMAPQSPHFRPSWLREDLGHLRCTIDNFWDYERTLKVFRGIEDVVNVPCSQLCSRLKQLPGEPTFRIPFKMKGDRPYSQMTLGTVQLGLAYGAANQTGRPDEATAIEIIRQAVMHGVTHLDCARAYGDAERVVGLAGAQNLRHTVHCITKLAPLQQLGPEASPDQVAQAVSASIFRSCHELQTRKLDILMLHRWAHHSQSGGGIWKELLALQDRGVLGDLGASVQNPQEALEAIAEPRLQVLQLPLNLLDWRWREAGVPEALQQRPDLVVHARSSLLQGLLLAPERCWPRNEGLHPAPFLAVVAQLTQELQRSSPIDLCLAYVRSQPWVDSVVVGLETLPQLAENLRLFQSPGLSPAELQRVDELVPRAPESLLNPALWQTV